MGVNMSELIAIDGSILREGRDYALLCLKPGDFLNVKIEGIQTFGYEITIDGWEVFPTRQPFVVMSNKEGKRIFSSESSLYHKVVEINELGKAYPFFCRVIGGEITVHKQKVNHPLWTDQWQDFKILVPNG